MQPLLELNQVTRAYGEGSLAVRAVDSISLTVTRGEFTAFVGPSGSGKTTLLNQIGCLDRPTSGEVSIEGRSTSPLSDRELATLRAQRIGFVFQAFNLIPVLTVRENVELAVQLAGREPSRDEVLSMLAQVGLGGLENRRPNQLSGGQQQRVAIARALVKKPALVIADEPTANLDSDNGQAVLELMQTLNRELSLTFLFSTHDPRVMRFATRIVRLRDGKLVDDREKAAGEDGGQP
jgi:putative ABC transport system ATP-binding protein